MRHRFLTFTIALIVTLALPCAAWAERDDLPPNERERVEERLRQMRERVLKKQVGLDDETAAKVEAILKEALADRREIRESLHEGKRELRRLLKSDSDDENAFAAALAKIRTGREDLAKLETRVFTDVAKILSSRKQAKLFAALNHMKRKMRGAR